MAFQGLGEMIRKVQVPGLITHLPERRPSEFWAPLNRAPGRTEALRLPENPPRKAKICHVRPMETASARRAASCSPGFTTGE